MHGMIDRYDALAGEIMRMMEDDRGLVRSKLADLLEKEVGAWKPDVTIGMVASASDHSKCAPLDLSPGSIHWMNAPTDVISAQPDGTRKRRHAIFDDEMDRLRRQWDLEDIRGKRFAHLLHLAESEGLLPELLQGAPDSRQESHRLAADDDTEVLLTSEPDHTCGND
jgi:hypothetical protein